MSDGTTALAAIATAALILGGGLALAAPFGDVVDDQLDPASEQPDETGSAEAQDGRMTVEHSEATHEGVEATAPPFYASRVVTIAGTLTLAELPVDLVTVNGQVDVQAHEEDSYELVANLTGYGTTPDQARENRDEMRLVWDAGEPGDRQLAAHVEHEEDSSDDEGDRKEADLTLRVPEPTAFDLHASSTNGAVSAEGLEAPSLSLQTTNGDVEATVAGTEEVTLGSTNGDVVAEIAPASSGSIEAQTTNGEVDVAVPETGERGYDVSASTTNGHASIALEDGERRSSDDGSTATFRTHGFADRSVQTTVSASSTNGDVHVGPAE